MAFHRDLALRTAALERLERRMKEHQLTPGALFLADGKATPAAALADSADLQVWQQRLGLAGWLAYAIDYGLGSLEGGELLAGVRRLFDAIEPGRDTRPDAGRVLAHVLSSVAIELETQGPQLQAVSAACGQLQTLHRQVAAGTPVDAARWRSARKAATAATNGLADTLDPSLGACVEASAWHPVDAPTTVGDVLRLRGQVPAALVDRRFGWTVEDEQRTRTLLREMHETYKVNHPEEQRDVFMLLRDHHPAAEARLRAYMQFQHAERARALQRAAEEFLQAMETPQ